MDLIRALSRTTIISLVAVTFLLSCNQNRLKDKYLEPLKKTAGDGEWKLYEKNPVLAPLPGSWDGAALGSMTTVIVNDTIHMYYEAWGSRSVSPQDPEAEYETLQIGHATSVNGIDWIKDKHNPVISRGAKGEWDEKGTWDPFIIYEDGIFKLWYGGGLSNSCDWGYAESTDGVCFTKKGKISELGNVEDIHVVHDAATGNYYLYYWDRAFEPDGLFVATSGNETDFDFKNASGIRISGEKYPGMYKFTQVIQEDGNLYMFYSDFVRPGCADATVRLAVSDDGKQWRTVNSRLLTGMDGDVIQVSRNLYLMYFGPEGYFDQKDCDIRLALFRGKLKDMIKPW